MKTALKPRLRSYIVCKTFSTYVSSVVAKACAANSNYWEEYRVFYGKNLHQYDNRLTVQVATYVRSYVR